jgi:hypothetical protein
MRLSADQQEDGFEDFVGDGDNGPLGAINIAVGAFLVVGTLPALAYVQSFSAMVPAAIISGTMDLT